MVRFGILTICLLFAVPSVAAQAQRADRAQRLDRLDRVQDRIAARDRIADRSVTDRVRERPVTDVQRFDITDEPIRDIVDADVSDASNVLEEDDSRRGAIILDPFGDRIRRGEVIALNPSTEALAELSRRDLREIRRRQLANDATLYLYRSAGAANVRDLLEALQAIDPMGLYAPNHVFNPTGEPVLMQEFVLPLVPKRSSGACSVGLIDGPVRALPARLKSAIAKTEQFEPGPVSDSVHGAAVAFRLIDIAQKLNSHHPVAICAADVFSAGPEGAITAEAIAGALDWQMAQEVELINASLAGPHNVVVAWSVERFISSGGTLVAAVGNGGPLSRNIYPAAYDGVIGVTAVDSEGRLYALASQGAHVDIAARGVDIDLAQIGIEDSMSGTSFAAPIVSGWIAAQGFEFDLFGETFADRGDRGRDAKFGVGELIVPSGSIVQTSHTPELARP